MEKYDNKTPVDRKSRVSQFQGIKAAAVIFYRKVLITQDMGIIGFPAEEKTWRKQTKRQEFTGGCISVVA
jgi:hypothetical protein